MTKFLYANQVRIFDFARFAEPLRDRVRERAALLAAERAAPAEGGGNFKLTHYPCRQICRGR